MGTPIVAIPTLRDKIFDALERAGSSAAEQLVVVATTTGATGLFNVPWLLGLATAGGAGLVSLLLTATQYLTKKNALTFGLDVTVRVAKTFVASLVGAFAAPATGMMHVSWHQALNVAGLSALLALGKCLVSPNAHLSGSLLPTPVVARLHGVYVDAGGFTKAG